MVGLICIPSAGFTQQLVCFVGFLEYGYQLIKKYITKMHSEGKVGVFMASVIWAIVSFLWSSGVLTAQLVRRRKLHGWGVDRGGIACIKLISVTCSHAPPSHAIFITFILYLSL